MRLTLERGLPARRTPPTATPTTPGMMPSDASSGPDDGTAEAVRGNAAMHNVTNARANADAAAPFARGARCLHCAFCILPWRIARGATRSSPDFMTGFIGAGQGRRRPRSPPQLKDVTFKQRLNEPLPLDATFKDEYGRERDAGRVLRRAAPVMLAFVYYQCPMLCTQVMNGISASLQGAAVHGRARTSTSCSSASIRATRRRCGARRSART